MYLFILTFKNENGVRIFQLDLVRGHNITMFLVTNIPLSLNAKSIMDAKLRRVFHPPPA